MVEFAGADSADAVVDLFDIAAVCSRSAANLTWEERHLLGTCKVHETPDSPTNRRYPS